MIKFPHDAKKIRRLIDLRNCGPATNVDTIMLNPATDRHEQTLSVTDMANTCSSVNGNVVAMTLACTQLEFWAYDETVAL
jgi:hypothetical protein